MLLSFCATRFIGCGSCQWCVVSSAETDNFGKTKCGWPVIETTPLIQLDGRYWFKMMPMVHVSKKSVSPPPTPAPRPTHQENIRVFDLNIWKFSLAVAPEERHLIGPGQLALLLHFLNGLHLGIWHHNNIQR